MLRIGVLRVPTRLLGEHHNCQAAIPSHRCWGSSSRLSCLRSDPCKGIQTSIITANRSVIIQALRSVNWSFLGPPQLCAQVSISTRLAALRNREEIQHEFPLPCVARCVAVASGECDVLLDACKLQAHGDLGASFRTVSELGRSRRVSATKYQIPGCHPRP